MPSFTGISHLDLTVTDVEASAAWYVEVLGLKRIRKAELDTYTMIMLAHRGANLIIGLLQHHVPVGDRFTERHPGLDHVGFAVEDRDELFQWQEHFEKLGVEHSPVTDAPSGSGTALVFRDPDNIQLEIWWTAPRN